LTFEGRELSATRDIEMNYDLPFSISVTFATTPMKNPLESAAPRGVKAAPAPMHALPPISPSVAVQNKKEGEEKKKWQLPRNVRVTLQIACCIF